MEELRRLEGVSILKGRVRVEGMEQSHVAVENIREQWRMLGMKFYVTTSTVHTVLIYCVTRLHLSRLCISKQTVQDCAELCRTVHE